MVASDCIISGFKPRDEDFAINNRLMGHSTISTISLLEAHLQIAITSSQNF